MKLKENILKEIKKNREVKVALWMYYENDIKTIDKWIKDNSPKLHSLPSLRIIAAYLKKDIDDLVTDTDQVFSSLV